MNGVNVYAGFNGLEAGLGVISAAALGVCAIFYGSLESAAALLALSGALLAFLRWNWYPARIFIGGSGTFLLGAVLASAIIAGSIKLAGVVALIPYGVNFVLRASDRFAWSVGETLPNGLLRSTKRNAMWALFMHSSTRREASIVGICLLVQTVFAAAAVAYAYYHVNFVLRETG
jgi:UDP-N-acetylglucosamine--dolichyl-phosphate N-acetylglucosaminephosphotransferase